MSIIFHEGMPRSGKSYEAMSRHVMRALAAGRPVDVYMEGLDLDKIAAAVELPVERVRELVQVFTREEVPTMHQRVRNNALVVIDEAQNFWPTGRLTLDPPTTQFITEHGHRGLDILLMGQVFKDVHRLWRGRTRIKVIFNKLDGVGMERRYNAQTWQATSPEKFVRVSDDTGTYDPKWFGTYSSHVDDTIQTGNFKDDRANLLKNWKFKFGLPVVAVIGVAAIGFLVWFMSGGAVPEKPKTPIAVASAPSAPAHAASVPQPQAPAAVRQGKEAAPFVVALNARYRARLGGHFTLGETRGGYVEWYDGDKLVERLTFAQIKRLGSVVGVDSEGVAIVADRFVTSWPVPERSAVDGGLKSVTGGGL